MDYFSRVDIKHWERKHFGGEGEGGGHMLLFLPLIFSGSVLRKFGERGWGVGSLTGCISLFS